jgi:hypothetical protein
MRAARLRTKKSRRELLARRFLISVNRRVAAMVCARKVSVGTEPIRPLFQILLRELYLLGQTSDSLTVGHFC